ncbi:MAG: glycosyltransferase [Deltaproteobacteria bacterium]|nr:glycosyltransferase [Deltaproteobacteria bacterium]
MHAEVQTPVRVAYVLPYLVLGGTEKQVCELVARIDRRRFEPIVIGAAGGGALEPEFARMGVPVRILGYRGLTPQRGMGWRSLRDAAACIFHMAALLRRERVGIVHSYLPAANFVAAAAGKIAGIPARVVSKRALSRDRKRYPYASWIENAGNLLANTVMVNSTAVEKDVMENERFWNGKIRLVYNGIDTALPGPEPIERLLPEAAGSEGAPVITYVGNFYPYKGHSDLINAARIVVEELPSAQFVLVGRDAGCLPAIREEIAALGLGSRFILAGSRHDAAGIIAASTLVVHPSHEEGFSNTILEAMAAGKAVVATAVGGNPEAVVDGETGILVPPRDPPAIAAALLSLLRNPDRAQAMGEAGRRLVRERFPMEKMVRGVERLYATLYPVLISG